MKKLFKTFCISVFLLMVLSSIGWGQRTLPTTEQFNYSTGELQTVGTDWTSISGGGNDLLVVAGSISRNGYLSALGNKVSTTNGAADDDKLAFTPQSIVGTKIFASFVVNVLNQTGLTTLGGYCWILGTGINDFASRIFIKSSGSGFALGISKTSTAPTEWSSELAVGTNHLIVIGYEIVSGATNDIAKIWINPNTTTIEPTADFTSSSGSDFGSGSDVNGFIIRQSGNTPTAELDDISIALNWSDLLKNPTFTSNGTIYSGTYNNLTLNGSGIILTLGNNITVSGTLTLTAGNITTGANSLTLGTGAAISGGSATSFVSGPINIITSSTSLRTVHIGSGTDYRSVGIQPAGTSTTTYTVEFKTGGFNTTQLTSPLVKVSQNDYISIDRTLGTENAKLTFTWTSDVGVTNLTDLRIAHWDIGTSKWVELQANTTGTTTSGSITTINDVTSFSPFAFGSVSDQPLPILLSAFNSTISNRNIMLNWTTASEINNSGFQIQRKSAQQDGGPSGVTGWQSIGFVYGKGTKNTPTSYSFDDKNLNTGKYKYRLKQIDHNENYEYFELNGEVEIGVPKKFDLSQNYPNPFNPVTKINFDLPVDSRVSILIYDVMGREVARVINNEFRKAGYYTTDFNAGSHSSGVYFYRLSTENFRAAKKMVVLK